MAKSILQSRKECYLCGTTINLHEHHVIHGTSNRKNSECTGLKVWLCFPHHEFVHKNRIADLQLKEFAQQEFEKSHTREEFIQIFGKSYL